MKDIDARIAELCKTFTHGIPVYDVTFADGTCAKMDIVRLALHVHYRGGTFSEPYRGADRVLDVELARGSPCSGTIMRDIAAHIAETRALTAAGVQFELPAPNDIVI